MDHGDCARLFCHNDGQVRSSACKNSQGRDVLHRIECSIMLTMNDTKSHDVKPFPDIDSDY